VCVWAFAPPCSIDLLAVQLIPVHPQDFQSDLSLPFNTKLLTATIVFGYITALFHLLFALALTMWRDRPDLLQVGTGRDQGVVSPDVPPLFYLHTFMM
jgi:hypothetical protein